MVGDTTTRRSFIDCQYGQMHLYTISPTAAGAIRRPPLLCIHQTPKSARQTLGLGRALARDRVVYAPDLPGFGDSDPPAAPPGIEDYADCLGTLLDALELNLLDILGNHTGAMNGVELALRRPGQVRRLVLIGVPLLNEAERDAIRAQPFPVAAEPDGSHLLTEWQRALRWAGPGQTQRMIESGFLDKLKAGRHGHWGAQAALAYPMKDKLARVSQPILAIGPRDDLWAISPRAARLIQHGRFEPWPDYGFGVMDVATAKLAAVIRVHLDPPDGGS
jgi:pimeloyl-ACP methyl ester carboxylesterase